MSHEEFKEKKRPEEVIKDFLGIFKDYGPQLRELDRQLDRVEEKIDEVIFMLDKQALGNISFDLEVAIREAALLSRKIDKKVPDIKV